ncbi:hypothetical protein [Zhihengliuella halotolerans]|uniref:hypothetical protein n=1 Tax=Zhihengliuella halotolerans TaxID=370736 RepID=UPI000C8101A4|nr:hypothetical protein [Zhihengliuella halotolerans]
MKAEELLEGPRGRRFVSEAMYRARARADVAIGHAAPPWWFAGVSESAAFLRGADPAMLRGLSERDLMMSIVESVDSAMYWQPPHAEDVMMAEPLVADVLRPAAEALAGHPVLDRLDRPLLAAPGRLAHPAGHIDWFDENYLERREPPHLARVDEQGRDKLDFWHERIQDDLRRRHKFAWRWRSVRANISGEWWAAPIPVNLLRTSALPDFALPDGAPPSTTASGGPDAGAPRGSGLLLDAIEDSFGWKSGTVTAFDLAPGAAPRVYEVDSSGAWASLVSRFPLDVTHVRRHDWFHVTGLDVPWFIPDWRRVAEEYDAVHVTLSGYLTTATRAVRVDSELGPKAHTMLAGWDPDQTFWFDAALRVTERFDVELVESQCGDDLFGAGTWRRKAS